jgi:hypothetical protein
VTARSKAPATVIWTLLLDVEIDQASDGGLASP